MKKTIIALFNLKPGIDPADYEKFVRETDAPTARNLPSVISWRGLKASGLFGSDATAPYQYFEIIDITDVAGFGQDAVSEGMKKSDRLFLFGRRQSAVHHHRSDSLTATNYSR